MPPPNIRFSATVTGANQFDDIPAVGEALNKHKALLNNSATAHIEIKLERFNTFPPSPETQVKLRAKNTQTNDSYNALLYQAAGVNRVVESSNLKSRFDGFMQNWFSKQ